VAQADTFINTDRDVFASAITGALWRTVATHFAVGARGYFEVLGCDIIRNRQDFSPREKRDARAMRKPGRFALGATPGFPCPASRLIGPGLLRKMFLSLGDQRLQIAHVEEEPFTNFHASEADPRSISFVLKTSRLDSKGRCGLIKTQKFHDFSYQLTCARSLLARSSFDEIIVRPVFSLGCRLCFSVRHHWSIASRSLRSSACVSS
jgi:hypothetical protein